MQEIAYFGSDESFVKRLNDFFGSTPTTSNAKVHIYKFEQENITNVTIKNRPYSLILDFTNIEVDALKELFTQLNYLKKNQCFNSIPIIAIFSSKEKVNQFSTFLALGLTYPYIKGVDEALFFSHIHYISFEVEIVLNKFPKANLSLVEAKAQMLSMINAFNHDSIILESDFKFQEGDIKKININLMKKDQLLAMSAIQETQEGAIGNFLGNTSFNIPFLGPTSESWDNLLLKDSYETWLDSLDEKVQIKRGKILLISSRPEDFLLAGKLASTISIDILVAHDTKEAEVIVNSNTLDIVFFRHSDQKNEVEDLNTLIQLVKLKQDERAIFVIFNSNSKSIALKKAMLYNKIIAINSELDFSFVMRLSDTYYQKELRHNKIHAYNKQDKRILAEIEFDINVISITEHELEFVSETPLAYYSLFKLYVPSEFFILVIPPLDTSEKINEYVGLIIGGDKSDYEKLHEFVNKAIEMKSASFSMEPYSKEKDSESVQTEEQENPTRVDIIRKKNKQGLAKLK